MLRTDEPTRTLSAHAVVQTVGRDVRDILRRLWKRRSVPALMVAVLAIVGFFLPGDLLYASSTALVAGLVGMALYLPIATLRELPLNAAGMVGLSAYMFALVATNGGIGNWLLGIALAASAAVGVSLLSGLAALVVTGLYFLVVSLVVQIGIEKVAFAVPGLTGGTSGFGVWQPVLGGWFSTARLTYLIVGVVILVVAVGVRALLRSRVGFHWVLVGHVPEGASAVGLRNWLVKLTVFALTGLLIALAGVLSTFINGTPPTTVSFTLIYSVIFVAIPIASGLRDLSSVWLVAAAFTAIPIILEQYHFAPNLISGLILLIALGLGYNRDRIGRGVSRGWDRVRRHRAPAGGEPEPADAARAGAVTLTGTAIREWSSPSLDMAARHERLRYTGNGAIKPDVLEGSRITVDFGGVRAVDDVSVRVGFGQRVGIIGANGAGKTTLFNALTGFAPLHSGTVRLGDDDITRWPSLTRARAGIRRTFQQPRLADVLTVEQNVVCGHGPDSSERRERVEWLLEHFGVAAMRGMPVMALPFGIRREVELIRALATVPQVLMLDEPVSGLEDEEAEKLVETLVTLQQREGWGLLVIEHDLKFITAVAQELMVMEDGHLLLEGPISDVMSQEQVRRVYLGELVAV